MRPGELACWMVALMLLAIGCEKKPTGATTPLHQAASAGDIGQVQSLISSGADVNAKDELGFTPLYVAAVEGHKDIAELLIVNLANVNVKSEYGSTPLHIAACQGHLDVAKLLIAKGANLNAKDRYGSTALHEAVLWGHRDIVEMMIVNGADVNAKTTRGETPLHYTTSRPTDSWRKKDVGHRSMAELLIAHGADVDAENCSGNTPLHEAIREYHTDMAKLLIAKGANINAKNWAGNTPLHLVVLEEPKYILYDAHRKSMAYDTDLVGLLITNGADVNAKNSSGNTPLHYAAGRNKSMTEVLLANGADVNAKDKEGDTPLHIAALRGCKDAAELLIAKGANVNAKDKLGKTPVYYAAAAGHYRIVQLLVAKGVDVSTKPKDTPVTAAMIAAAQPNVATLVQDNSAFAFDLYQQLCSCEGNLFFSPYSISAALAMTYAGARGNTEKQMAETLHFSLDQEKLHPAYTQLQAWMNQLQESGGVKLSVANSLWPQQSYRFLDGYLSLVKKHYGASITSVDYKNAPEVARKTINQWIDDKTEHKIKDMIQSGVLDPLTTLVLANAIYFKGKWANPFHPHNTSDGPFYISATESVKIPLMALTARVRYGEMESLQVLELPYVGNRLSMLVLLPKEIEGLGALETILSAKNLQAWRRSLHKTKVYMIVPKFKMTCQFRLDKALQAMGVTDAFSLPLADFSGVTGTPDLFISAVIHKAFIEVNEEGTEAAAATGVGLPRRGAVPPVFKADHPFLLIIHENHTGSILFMGRVADPTKSGQ